MQNLLFRMSETSGEVHRPGRRIGHDTYQSGITAPEKEVA